LYANSKPRNSYKANPHPSESIMIRYIFSVVPKET
jgi:hypothetical protein